jgi:hypothetical protein
MNPDYKKNKIDNKHAFSNCIANGLYCAFPRYDLDISDGREIIYENIRQKCIYFISNGIYKLKEFPQKINKDIYWNYMEKFYDKCIKGNISIEFNEKCSSDTVKEIGLNEILLRHCVYNSYENPQNFSMFNNNLLLEEENISKKKWNIKMFPSFIVNNKIIKGDINANNLLEAICASMVNKDEICYTKGFFKKDNYNSFIINFFVIFGIFIFFLAFNFLVYVICRRFINKKLNEKIQKVEIHGKINQEMTKYFSLRENKI